MNDDSASKREKNQRHTVVGQFGIFTDSGGRAQRRVEKKLYRPGAKQRLEVPYRG